MKRLFVIPVLMLYLLAVSGVMIHVHYCGQQLASWNVYVQPPGCGDCGDESAPGHSCCHDEVIAAKVSVDHSLAFFKYKLNGEDAFTAAALLPEYPELGAPQLPLVVASSALPHAPPGVWQQIPLYRLYSRLTYYG
jgi:hypothetical protein